MATDYTFGTEYLWISNGKLARAIRLFLLAKTGLRADVRVMTRCPGIQCWRISHPDNKTADEWAEVLEAVQGQVCKKGGDARVDAFHWFRPDPDAEGNEML